jgi:Reverse transcriptase (RNA-dependent DNA polymerase)
MQKSYMWIPEGYVRYMLEVLNKVNDTSTHVLLFKKAIYGLVQAARQWWNKFKEAMDGCNYFPSYAAPCLFIKKANGDEPLSFVIMFGDVGGNFGTPEAIKEVTEALSQSFKVTTIGEMSKFVECHIIKTGDKDGVWIQKTKIAQESKGELKISD